jgi:hypothetical protein
MAMTLRCAACVSTGQIKWAGELIFVGEVLIGEPVGITETERGDWLVRCADVELAYIHPQRRRLSPRPLCGTRRPGDLMEIAAAIPRLHCSTTATSLMLMDQDVTHPHLSIRLHTPMRADTARFLMSTRASWKPS